MSRLEALVNELYEWQQDQDLPPMCAYEQLHEDYITAEQAEYLRAFIARWDLASEE